MDYCLNEKYKNKSVEPKFVGLFYYWVADPFEKYDDIPSSVVIDGFEKKKGGLGGVANDNEEILSNAFNDISFSKMKKGNIKNATLKNGCKIGSKYIERAELDDYIEIMRKKVVDTVDNMNEGRISATEEPYTCKVCAYSNICRKDRTLEKSEDSTD